MTARSLVLHQPMDLQSQIARLSLHLNQFEAFYDNPPMRGAVLDGQNLWLLFLGQSVLLLQQYRIAIAIHAFLGYNQMPPPIPNVRRIYSVRAPQWYNVPGAVSIPSHEQDMAHVPLSRSALPAHKPRIKRDNPSHVL